MKIKYIIIIFILSLIINSCFDNKKGTKNIKTKDTISVNYKNGKDTLPIIDTIIILNNLSTLKSNKNLQLTQDIAKNKIYNYFINKGYKLLEMEKTHENVCLKFDTAYFVNLNNDRSLDAIILFWEMPCFASGHCYQPSKAILISSDNDYIFKYHGFIPRNFAIDSIKEKKVGEIMIYGFDYDCGDHKIVKKINLKLMCK